MGGEMPSNKIAAQDYVVVDSTGDPKALEDCWEIRFRFSTRDS
jgi:hypothetical protein